MGIEAKHPLHLFFSTKWALCRDVFDGDRVKEAGESYLSKLSGMTPDEYKAYKLRAVFYEIFARAVTAMVGAVMRRAPVIENFDEDRLKDIGASHEDIESLINAALKEGLVTSFMGIFTDVNNKIDDKPRLSIYPAESIWNWRMGEDGELAFVVLHENIVIPDEKDPFTNAAVEQLRLLAIVTEADVIAGEGLVAGNYFQQLYRNKSVGNKKAQAWEVFGDPIVPGSRGTPLTRIPFVFMGMGGIGPYPVKPVLLAMANMNLSHYRTSADLEHGRHFTALPTPWFSGISADKLGTSVRMGSGAGIVLPPKEARAGMLEFTGKGLGALVTASEEKVEYMATLGARFIQDTRSGVEAAETARLRQAGEVSALIVLVKVISEGFQKALSFVANWTRDGEGSDVLVSLNTDLVDKKMAPLTLTALLKTRIAREMSQDSFLSNMKEGEMLGTRSIEDEKRLIAVEREAELSAFMDASVETDDDDEGDAE